jgi:hypothetical protein
MAIKKQAIFTGIGIAFLISIIGVFRSDPDTFDKSRMGIFIKIISALAFVLVALGLILTAQAFEEGQKLSRIDQTFKLIDRGLMNVCGRMQEYYKGAPRFVSSLWPQKGLFTTND